MDAMALFSTLIGRNTFFPAIKVENKTLKSKTLTATPLGRIATIVTEEFASGFSMPEAIDRLLARAVCSAPAWKIAPLYG